MPDSASAALTRPDAERDPVALLDGVPLSAAEAGYVEAAAPQTRCAATAPTGGSSPPGAPRTAI